MNKQTSLFLSSILSLLAITLILATCGQSGPVTSQTSNTSIPTSPSSQAIAAGSGDAANLLFGIYSTVLKLRDYQPQFIEAAPALKNYFGRWELNIAGERHFSLSLNNRLVVEGDYQLTTDQIYFTASTSWPSLCPDNQDRIEAQEGQVATYRWTLDGPNLQFFGTDVPCSVRGLVFSHDWQLTATGSSLNQ